MPTPEPVHAWRVFPWDQAADDGARFSPSFVPEGGGTGRFDLEDEPVLYLAEDATHAVAEKIGRFRGGSIGSAHLTEFGLPLALVSVDVPAGDAEAVLDLCDPKVLVALSVRPDEIAARDRETSQAVARTVAGSGAVGLRWWSSFFGEWHGVVFLERLSNGLQFGEPRILDLEDEALVEAMEVLGMR